jgi:hypothetical protein
LVFAACAALTLAFSLVAAACSTILGLDGLQYSPDSGGGGVDAGEAAAADAIAPSDAALRPDGPFTVVTGLTQPKGLVVDETRLYWTDQGTAIDGGSVQDAPKTAGAPIATLATGQSLPLDIATDSQKVYWSVSEPLGSAGGAMACNAMSAAKTGAAAPPQCLTQTPYATLRMTITDDDVVFIAQGATNQQFLGFAAKAPPGPYTKAMTMGPASAVAATDTTIYVSNGNGSHIDSFSLAQMIVVGPNVCVNGCGTTAIVDMVLDVNLANALWVTMDGSVYTAPLVNGNATGKLLGTIGASPQRMARDTWFVYVTSQNGSVYALHITGTGVGAGPIALATGEPGPFGIAADAQYVYWTTSEGTIRATGVPPH